MSEPISVKVYQFWAHAGDHHAPFVGRPEDCGYWEAEDGWRDARGNTGEMHSEDFDHELHTGVLLNAWSEDGRLERGDEEHFLRWARQEIGLDHDTAVACLAAAIDDDPPSDSDRAFVYGDD